MILTGAEAGTDILQTPTEIRMVAEEQHNNRRIYINQPHSNPLVRSLNGDSVAHWDGNTLVIETTGLIGYGVSPTLVRTERLSKSADGTTLTDQVSYSDSSGLPTPAAMTAQAKWWPGNQVLEYICEDGGFEYMKDDYK